VHLAMRTFGQVNERIYGYSDRDVDHYGAIGNSLRGYKDMC